MSERAISVEGIGKRYRLGRRQPYKTAREAIVQAASRLTGRRGDDGGTFWALKDVGFEVRRGEVVGIIGRNGAGKSTLLKILSRITEPTEGCARIEGRVGSLLEVGTGFHPELSGRENIYLSGAILGMRRSEIRTKFDQIVAFAQIEQFIDTPVKHYSSGMFTRLAFSVAAHLETEILLVDEVLAVGDAEFQRKCLGKMSEVAHGGKTVLFVSHNMNAIKALCTTGVFLEKGRVGSVGSLDTAIAKYMGEVMRGSRRYEAKGERVKPHIRAMEVTQEGAMGEAFACDRPLRFRFDLEMMGKERMTVSVVIRSAQGLVVHHTSDELCPDVEIVRRAVRECEVPGNALAPGRYVVDVALGRRNFELYEAIEDIVDFEVEFSGPMSDRTAAREWKGACAPGLIAWR